MHFVFLGTSAGTPTRERNVSALAVCPDQPRDWMLVDCGEGTQHQILRSRLRLPRLRHILITHLHGDHSFGLPGLLSSRAMSGATDTLDLHGPEGLRTFLMTALNLSNTTLTYDLAIRELSGPGPVLETGTLTVEALAMTHTGPCYGYLIREKAVPGRLDAEALAAAGVPAGPDYGRLKKGETVRLPDGRVVDGREYLSPPLPGRNVLVAGDNDDPGSLVGRLSGVDLLVHEATYTSDVAGGLAFDPGHSTAAAVAAAAEQASIPNLVLTHISARYATTPDARGRDVEDLRKEAENAYSGCLFVADDFDELVLDRARCVVRAGQAWRGRGVDRTKDAPHAGQGALEKC